MAQIISHTPLWVFVLFFILLALGFLQTKQRIITLQRASILPIAMILLSCYGVFSAFGIHIFAFVLWLIGIGIAIILNQKMNCVNQVDFDKQSQQFKIKGSWQPLFLMMLIFFTKYAVGVITAKNLPLLHENYFIVLVSFLYGFISGAFFGRFLNLLQRKRLASVS